MAAPYILQHSQHFFSDIRRFGGLSLQLLLLFSEEDAQVSDMVALQEAPGREKNNARKGRKMSLKTVQRIRVV
jgi:hypothetical protein